MTDKQGRLLLLLVFVTIHAPTQDFPSMVSKASLTKSGLSICEALFNSFQSPLIPRVELGGIGTAPKQCTGALVH